ncbi:hypothetical protein [Nonomuraea rubra]|uniref:hypothetical protein n=1 Tax=Nonomuraea rubra TaxID=46180 RepID=UPI0031EAC270
MSVALDMPRKTRLVAIISRGTHVGFPATGAGYVDASHADLTLLSGLTATVTAREQKEDALPLGATAEAAAQHKMARRTTAPPA